MSIETIREFLGWSSLINIGVLLFYSMFIILWRSKIAPIHMRIFQLGENDVSRGYFQYLSYYKILIIIFNIVPYFALVIMD
ncbi:DUF6868 family protein [Hydrogenimonas thermophila]|uniref:DUF6868 domain-containing protein n=1 Tax=Hydrogenimonas thermophila TaxID=223786 RepID=A0A1I5PXH9_9BACT|nr:hypothetical protein SAMN05216234_11732 [Hydrogenimonas thermophila]